MTALVKPFNCFLRSKLHSFLHLFLGKCVHMLIVFIWEATLKKKQTNNAISALVFSFQANNSKLGFLNCSSKWSGYKMSSYIQAES